MASEETPYIESDGPEWYQRTLHLNVGVSFEELQDIGFGPYQGVGTVTLHLIDGHEISVGSSQEHALEYRGGFGDITPPEDGDQ